MADDRYTYNRVNVIKVILLNEQDKVLLLQEPLTNEWMPGHWGLPGGKPLVNESLLDTYQRKMQGEIGYVPELLGIFRIEELLRPDDGGTVLMFILVAKAKSIEIHGETDNFRWMNGSDIKNMDLAEFTEYYNRKLLLDYLEGNRSLYPTDILETWRYYMTEQNDPEYRRWYESGINQS